jgi:DmsE family decaheme c-type cytochrome
MSCSSCHTPHGSSIGLVKSQENLAELYLSCHTQYQGPFIFEHDSVMEGCDTCHVPHGSVANNLLAQNEPFLCLQCHEFHFHAALLSPDGPIDVGGTEYENPFGDQSMNVAFTTKCSQCHSQVHGTDLPSQTVSGGGHGMVR